MEAIITFVGGLSVAGTGALALGIVAALLIVPPLAVYTVQRIAETVRGCRDEIEYDPAWMDAKIYKQLEREEREQRRGWRRGA